VITLCLKTADSQVKERHWRVLRMGTAASLTMLLTYFPNGRMILTH
jgi:hypothetical protein